MFVFFVVSLFVGRGGREKTCVRNAPTTPVSHLQQAWSRGAGFFWKDQSLHLRGAQRVHQNPCDTENQPEIEPPSRRVAKPRSCHVAPNRRTLKETKSTMGAQNPLYVIRSTEPNICSEQPAKQGWFVGRKPKAERFVHLGATDVGRSACRVSRPHVLLQDRPDRICLKLRNLQNGRLAFETTPQQKNMCCSKMKKTNAKHPGLFFTLFMWEDHTHTSSGS